MTSPEPSCPLTRSAVIERYFMERRHRLIDLAAFLDRLDRAPADGEGTDDFRIAALRRAMAILLEEGPGRTRRILECLSDPTEAPIESAAGMKGAFGAWPGSHHASRDEDRGEGAGP